jgi:rhamnulokinase
MTAKRVIAIDLGATSGRVMQVSYDGKSLHLDELHRFPNIPVTANGTLYWDALRLWHEIQTGIKAVPAGAASIGVDAWGVDFALLDRDGRLLANPVHYRDSSSDGMMEWVFEHIPRRELYQRTGIQMMPANGIWRLAGLARYRSPLLDAAHTYLTIADLFNYWMSGSKTCEYTHVSTHQIYDPYNGSWDVELLQKLGVPTGMFGEIVQPGTRLGAYNGIPVIASASHDTASAVVAVPTTTKNYAYNSSGTWSLLGLELEKPVINDAAYEANATNEGGVNGTIRFLKNIAGMWLIEQSRATWHEQGQDYEYGQLAALAEASTPFQSFIDPDADDFFAPGDMPGRIRDYCQRTGQPVPEHVGEVVRTIYESLALKYRLVLENLTAVSGQRVDLMHIIGGGSRNALVCQMTANAIGHPVVAGPAEATALGNAVVQLVALGEFKDIAEARQLLSQSEGMVTYQPKGMAGWDRAYERFQAVIGVR